MIFFEGYFEFISQKTSDIDNKVLIEVARRVESSSLRNGKVIIIGNGGSAAIASHVSIDLTKAANIRSINFNEASLITCFANDYGYEHWAEKAIEFYADKNDLIILISSSGQSKNIINAATKTRELGLNLVTLSGFKKSNPLRVLGDINLWIDSDHYNTVETVHQTWLLSIVDYLISNQLKMEKS